MTTIRIGRVSAAAARVRWMGGEYLLITEVSRALSVSTSTLRRLAAADSGQFGPSQRVPWGKLSLPVYDMETIGRLHQRLAESRSRRGHPRLWSDEELRQRRAACSAVGYRRRRAAQLRDRGDDEGARRADAEADRLRRRLRHARTIRLDGTTADCRDTE